MKIYKLGGILIKDEENLKAIDDFFQDSQPSCIVISAFAKTSNKLKNVAELASKNNLEHTFEICNELKDFHLELFPDQKQLIVDTFIELETLLKSISLIKELNNRTLDRVLSFGDILAAKIICDKYSNHNTYYLDPTNFLYCDGDFGFGNPNVDLSRKLFSELDVDLSKHLIMPGFIGRNKDSQVITMGFESSNLSAIIIAIITESSQVEIITNVDGIKTVDPEVSSKFVHLEYMSYNDAKIAGKIGMKLLPEKMIQLAYENNITVVFRGLNNNLKTLISPESKSSNKLIIQKNELYVLNINQEDLNLLIDNYPEIDFRYSSPHKYLIVYSSKPTLDNLAELFFSN